MILCAGEALIDMIPATTVDGDQAFVPRAGGAPFNTAIALARLGENVGFATGLSLDSMGALLLERASDSGVNMDGSVRSQRPTTLAMVTLVNGQAEYSFYDSGSALREIQPGELTLPSPAPAAALFGGICLASEPCGAAFETLFDAARAAGVTILFDPNIRPAFVTDEGNFRARISRMMARSDIVKLSDEDLEWLMGAGDVATHAQAILKLGPSMLCVTQGGNGVTAYLIEKTVSVPAEKVDVIDTVGAGDTFNAGFLAGLSQKNALSRDGVAKLSESTITHALTLGARAAAICVSRAGANPPTLAEVEAHFEAG